MVSFFRSPAYLAAPTAWDGVTETTIALNNETSDDEPFVHYFSTKGILQHNDIDPVWHPTDVGAIKVASHLTQFIKLTFGWEMVATGPEYVTNFVLFVRRGSSNPLALCVYFYLIVFSLRSPHPRAPGLRGFLLLLAP